MAAAGGNTRPACAHCGHGWSAHTAGQTGECAKRIPVAWTGRGKTKRPVMGYCPCPRYDPIQER